ncbi:PREDICTED: histone H2A-beta, sperm-like [Vollenhovia emeryi]|uniref:histone H2A-beta, sperm-like n=1 Tax=Vollenhovia emeryi TaxID=411798 RepID=UPI0005F4CE60|nr:PREDICTED: histone H2A-beta, sperm-like [Vollenhovia emeryi]
MSTRGKGGKVRTKAKSKSVRAGLQFPVGRIHRCLRSETRMRVAVGAAIYVGAVMEYLCAEVLELCGNTALKAAKRRIKPCHLSVAINADDELKELTQNAIISCGRYICRKSAEPAKPAST